MEHILRCNLLQCHKELSDRALVTACSHIFCTDCATRLGLIGQGHQHHNSCPACDTHLTNPGDAVVTNLNPSEDYKTRVLSGLSPNAIIECVRKALRFWAYQATQEMVYKDSMLKKMTDEYLKLSVHLDKVIHEADLKLITLQNELTRARTDNDDLRKKYDELTQAFKDKNRKLLQTQELYDKLKRKERIGQMQDVADEAVDSTLLPPRRG